MSKKKVHFRFFLHPYGAEYVPCKKVNRNGKSYYRNAVTGEEIPAGRTALNLTGDKREEFVRAHNRSLASGWSVQRAVHPEGNWPPEDSVSCATYEEILEGIIEEYRWCLPRPTPPTSEKPQSPAPTAAEVLDVETRQGGTP